jgi:hypothetical protein
MTEPEILAALLVVNKGRCTPPLKEGEVRQIAASVSRYTPTAKPPGDETFDAAVWAAVRGKS